MTRCFECGNSAQHQHHVIPKSYGGTKTIPLCCSCHGKVHSPHLLKTSIMTKKAMQKMISEGRYTGGQVKYGYKVVKGKLVEDETEQCAITLIKKYRSLKWSYLKIGRVLKDAGYVSRTGKKLSHKSIKHILERTPVA